MSGDQDEASDSEMSELEAGQFGKLHSLVAEYRDRLQELHLLGLHLDDVTTVNSEKQSV